MIPAAEKKPHGLSDLQRHTRARGRVVPQQVSRAALDELWILESVHQTSADFPQQQYPRALSGNKAATSHVRSGVSEHLPSVASLLCTFLAELLDRLVPATWGCPSNGLTDRCIFVRNQRLREGICCACHARGKGLIDAPMRGCQGRIKGHRLNHLEHPTPILENKR